MQVFYPGIGWVNSDPTAGAVLQTTAPSVRQRVGTWLTRLWHRVPGGRSGAVVALVLAVVVGTVAQHGRTPMDASPAPIRGRRSRAAGRWSDPGCLPSTRRRIARSRARAASRAESLGELAGRLGGFVATPGEVAAAISYLERETYGVDPPSAAESAAAIAVFDRLRLGAGSQLVAVAAATGGGTTSAR